MIRSKSAMKRVRQNERRRIRNRSVIRTYRTEEKKFTTALTAGQTAQGESMLRALCRRLDKLVTKGVVRKGTAARRKSRLTLKLNALKRSAGS